MSWRVGVRPEAERTVATLADNPLRYREVMEGVRRVLAPRFPYVIAYRVEGDEVIVDAAPTAGER